MHEDRVYQRLTKDEYGILLAVSASLRSEDPKTQVGAVIVNEDYEVLSSGCNGLAKGLTLHDVSPDPIQDSVRLDHMIHAEQNAFRLVHKREKPAIIYTTISPCIPCCQTIASYGIKKVVYKEQYHRCDKFKKFFDIYGIRYEQLSSESAKRIKNSIKNKL